MSMRLDALPDPDAVAEHAAALIGSQLRRAVEANGHASFAVSGGTTPFPALRRLAESALPWDRLDIFQVDERIAPDGDEDRNATHLRRAFAACLPGHEDRFHWMPVAAASPAAGAAQYAELLGRLAGSPPTIDLLHLGLGEDGHTASLFAGDGALDVVAAGVTVTDEHLGRRRMTLTLPVLNRARSVVWLVTGASKRGVLDRLLRADPTLIASRVRRDRACVIADAAAAGGRRSETRPLC